ncbi:MAG: polysaccharide export protein EpsE, partial [Dokdonella sp.]
LDASMTVIQAIARGGGITTRGSQSRIEIRRKHADGRYTVIDANLSDPVMANDIIQVKERIF